MQLYKKALNHIILNRCSVAFDVQRSWCLFRNEVPPFLLFYAIYPFKCWHHNRCNSRWLVFGAKIYVCIQFCSLTKFLL